MSRLMGESQMGYLHSSEEESRGYTAPREMVRSGGGVSGWLIAGLALAGLGALAAYYIGPELYRYKKIRDM